MRTIIRSVALATVTLCATAAFAVNRAVVDIPFNFVSQGKAFPAGKYIATVDTNHNVLALSSATDTRLSAHWSAGPAESDPFNEKLILKFDVLEDGRSALCTVQLGSRITSRLDGHARHRNAGSIEAEMSAQ